MTDRIESPYDAKTFAEVLDDYVLVRGDLSAEYAREQLVRIVAQRVADAEQAGYDRAVAEGRNATATTLVQRVDAFARTLETEETSTPGDTEDGTFPMSASNWDLAVHAIADDLRDTVRSTSDVLPAGASEPIATVIAEIEAVHGPHIECGNSGCRNRGLSGMHCIDNDDCNDGAHEDCPFVAIAARLRAATTAVPAAQVLREVAYEIVAELICCSGEDPSTYEHAICKWAGFARALVIDRAERIENGTGFSWTHTRDNTLCADGPVENRRPFCGDHGLEVRLERAEC